MATPWRLGAAARPGLLHLILANEVQDGTSAVRHPGGPGLFIIAQRSQRAPYQR